MARPTFLQTISERGSALAERFERLGLREEDIDETFIRSSGKGGQNVNKVATCVVLVHRPTGMHIKCQAERSQAANRLRARQMLAAQIEQARAMAARQAQQQREAQRRKARPLPRKVKRAMVEAKRARAKTKAHRGRVSFAD